MDTYQTLDGQNINLDECNVTDRGDINRLLQLLPPQHFTARTVRTLGKGLRVGIDTPAGEQVRRIAEDVWRRILLQSGIDELDAAPDMDPSWSRGLFIHHIGTPEKDSNAPKEHFSCLVDTTDFTVAGKQLERLHAVAGRRLTGWFAGHDAVQTMIIRLADAENADIQDTLTASFGRAFTAAYEGGRRRGAIDITPLYDHVEDEIRYLRGEYGDCVGHIIGTSISLGSYYGMRMRQ